MRITNQTEEFAAEFMEHERHYRVHRSPPLDHIHNQIYQVYTLSPNFLKIRLILFSHLPSSIPGGLLRYLNSGKQRLTNLGT